jgi:hypothetical protein
MSIVKAQKSVENIRSWEDAAAHTKQRIKELRQSLKLFEEKIEAREPWPAQLQDQGSGQQHSV